MGVIIVPFSIEMDMVPLWGNFCYVFFINEQKWRFFVSSFNANSCFLKLPAPPHQAIDSAGERETFFIFRRGLLKSRIWDGGHFKRVSEWRYNPVTEDLPMGHQSWLRMICLLPYSKNECLTGSN